MPRLYLVGGGDPLLATPERIALDQRDPETAGLPNSPLATLADRIVAAGVRGIPGGIVGVDDRYDRTRYLPEWPASVRTDIGPIGALTVNDGRAGPGRHRRRGRRSRGRTPRRELSRLLVARGVAVGPAGRADHAPDGATRIASLDSPPLPKVLEELLSASDNLSAEMLDARARRPGRRRDDRARRAGHPRRAHEAARRSHRRAASSTAPASPTTTGSRAPRCSSVLGARRASRGSRAVADGLAIAGKRGTLALSLRGTHLEDNLRAKTGTLSGVSGLAGYVRSDRPLTFALLLGGGFSQNTGYALREAMATDIAAYPAVRRRRRAGARPCRFGEPTFRPGLAGARRRRVESPGERGRGRRVIVVERRARSSSAGAAVMPNPSARRPSAPRPSRRRWRSCGSSSSRTSSRRRPSRSSRSGGSSASASPARSRIGIGVVFFAIGGLRLLQEETDAFHGNWSFVPYVVIIILLCSGWPAWSSGSAPAPRRPSR